MNPRALCHHRFWQTHLTGTDEWHVVINPLLRWGVLNLAPKRRCRSNATAPKTRHVDISGALLAPCHARKTDAWKRGNEVSHLRGSSRAVKHANAHARTYDCQLTLNTHRGSVFTLPDHGCSIKTERGQISSPLLLPTSWMTLPCVTGLKRSVGGLPSRFFWSRSPCRRSASSVSLSLLPTVSHSYATGGFPESSGRAHDVMTHEPGGARPRHARSRFSQTTDLHSSLSSKRSPVFIFFFIILLILHPEIVWNSMSTYYSQYVYVCTLYCTGQYFVSVSLLFLFRDIKFNKILPCY